MSSANNFSHNNQTKCHSRYKAILDNLVPSEEKLCLQQDFTKWKDRLLYKQFWTEPKTEVL